MRHRHATRLALALVLLSMLGVAAIGCNTVEGVGEDVESAGDSIEDAADDE